MRHTSPSATVISLPRHMSNPTSEQLAECLTRHFHARCTVRHDTLRALDHLRIVTPFDAVKAAVEMYLAGKNITWTITREAN